jgi:hypothetical protein
MSLDMSLSLFGMIALQCISARGRVPEGRDRTKSGNFWHFGPKGMNGSIGLSFLLPFTPHRHLCDFALSRADGKMHA